MPGAAERSGAAFMGEADDERRGGVFEWAPRGVDCDAQPAKATNKQQAVVVTEQQRMMVCIMMIPRL